MNGSNEFKIDHLGIAVRSIDAALGFLRDQLGMPWRCARPSTRRRSNVAMLPAGESRIELLEPASADSPDREDSSKSAAKGLHHVALRVPDLAAAVEKLKAGGARLLNEPRTAPAATLRLHHPPQPAAYYWS